MTTNQAQAAAAKLVGQLKKANASVSGPQAPRIKQADYAQLQKRLQSTIEKL